MSGLPQPVTRLTLGHRATAARSQTPSAPRRAAASRALRAVLLVLALVPVVNTLTHWHSTARNIVYWDEIDAVLPFLLQLQAGMNPERFVGALLEVINEHRPATSRLLFALSYRFTGTVDFVWIGAIGNAFIVTACALLVWAERENGRRLSLAVILGFTVFHLGGYENFLWSGSSIDHFQVIALATAALIALGRGGRGWFRVAMVAGALASFTLAHGLMVWPAGAVMLARERRRIELACWLGAAALVTWAFLAGFHWNPGHFSAATDLAAFRAVAVYWLRILGAPLAFGHDSLAGLLGGVLIALVVARSVWAEWSVARTRLSILWFLAGAALLIALGRAEVTQGHVFSRYTIVGGLAWALILFDLLPTPACARRPLLVLGCAVPLLAAFNLAQNLRYRGDAATFVENRDRAALRFRQFGEDGHSPLTLHPRPGHANELLRAAAQRGVYRMPPLCTERSFPHAQPSDRLTCHLDESTVGPRAAYLAGWVTVRGARLRRGAIHVVLRSAERTAVFTAVAVRRPDVVNAFHNPDWVWSGFRCALGRGRLPPAEYQIGFLVDDAEPEFALTEHRLDLRERAKPTAASD